MGKPRVRSYDSRGSSAGPDRQGSVLGALGCFAPGARRAGHDDRRGVRRQLVQLEGARVARGGCCRGARAALQVHAFHPLEERLRRNKMRSTNDPLARRKVAPKRAAQLVLILGSMALITYFLTIYVDWHAIG